MDDHTRARRAVREAHHRRRRHGVDVRQSEVRRRRHHPGPRPHHQRRRRPRRRRTAIPPSDDPRRDMLNFVHGLESLSGATYQAFVALFSEPSLRAEAMTVGARESPARRAAGADASTPIDQADSSTSTMPSTPSPPSPPTTVAPTTTFRTSPAPPAASSTDARGAADRDPHRHGDPVAVRKPRRRSRSWSAPATRTARG